MNKDINEIIEEKINIEISEKIENNILDISHNNSENIDISNNIIDSTYFRQLLVNNYLNNKKIKVYIPNTKKIDKKVYNLIRNNNFIQQNNEQRTIIINEVILNEEIVPEMETLTCRICLEEDSEDNLITPCSCIGTHKYIHLDCLNQWRDFNVNNPEKRDNCDICKQPYNYNRTAPIVFNVVLSNKIINNTWLYFFCRYGFIISFSLLYSLFDINTGFFTYNILTFYSSDNDKSNIIANFRYINKNNDILSLVNAFVFCVFHFTFINYVFNIFYYNCVFRKKLLFNTQYDSRYRILMTRTYKIFLTQQYLFPLSFYSSVIFNNYIILAFTMIFVFLINVIYIENFISKHNETVRFILGN